MPSRDEFLYHFEFALESSAPQPNLQVFDGLRFAVTDDLCGGRQFHLGDDLLGQRFHLTQAALLTRRNQCDGDARLASASRAPNTMDVHFGVIGQVIIEDVRNIVDVQTTRGDIGCDQHLQLVATETFQHTFAGILIQVTVDGFGWDSAHDEFVGESRGLGAGAGKDQRAVNGFDLEQAGQRVGLVVLVDKVIALLCGRKGERALLDDDRLRGAHEAVRQFANPRGHGRAEQRSLPFGRGHCKNLFDLFDESHVEHFVGFVEDDGFDFAQIQDAAFQQIVQTSRGANDNIYAALETVDLRAVGLPAIDGEDSRPQILAVLDHRIGNLQGKLTGGRKHQGLRILLMFKVLKNGEGEGGGFACACLGLTDHVRAGEHERNHARLNGGWLGIAEFGDGLHDLVTQVERRKIGCHLGPFLSLRGAIFATKQSHHLMGIASLLTVARNNTRIRERFDDSA